MNLEQINKSTELALLERIEAAQKIEALLKQVETLAASSASSYRILTVIRGAI